MQPLRRIQLSFRWDVDSTGSQSLEGRCTTRMASEVVRRLQSSVISYSSLQGLAHPFWCDAAGVVKIPLMPFSPQNSSRPFTISLSSLAAPTICVPLSLNITAGYPRIEKNVRSTCMNSIVVRSTAHSRWTALVFKHVNMTP